MSDVITELDGLIADLEIEVTESPAGGDENKSELCSIGCSTVC